MEIQFIGVAGITELCIKAVLRYLQFDDLLSKVLVITNDKYTFFNHVCRIQSGYWDLRVFLWLTKSLFCE